MRQVTGDDLGRLARAQQGRADDHLPSAGVDPARIPPASRSGVRLLAADVVQRDVAGPLELVVAVPVGLAVADESEGHGSILHDGACDFRRRRLVPPRADLHVLRPSRVAYARAFKANLWIAIPLLAISIFRIGLNPWLLPVFVVVVALSFGGVLLYFRNARVEFGGAQDARPVPRRLAVRREPELHRLRCRHAGHDRLAELGEHRAARARS